MEDLSRHRDGDATFEADERGVVRVVHRTFASNSYLCPTGEPGTCVVIDPGLDGALVERALEAAGLRPLAVVSTHGHFDHVGTAEELRLRHGIPHYLHRDDLRIARQANFLMTMCRIPARITVPQPDRPFDGDAAVELPGGPLRLRPVPGHTPGSTLVCFGGVAFSGDTLYRRGMDTLALPGSDAGLMRRSILALWDSLPEETWIYPGHGASASFGDIKRNNMKLRAFLDGAAPGDAA